MKRRARGGRKLERLRGRVKDPLFKVGKRGIKKDKGPTTG